MQSPEAKKYVHESFNVLRFKIEVIDISPKIWRRIQIPKFYNFQEFHVAIIETMRWPEPDSYLFRLHDIDPANFLAIDPQYAKVLDIKDSFVKGVKSKATYVYGSNQEYCLELICETECKAMNPAFYPKLLEGKRASPFLNFGGTPKYKELCDTIFSRPSQKRQETLDWLKSLNIELWHIEIFDPSVIVYTDKHKLSSCAKAE